jgi:hypothetical protein
VCPTSTVVVCEALSDNLVDVLPDLLVHHLVGALVHAGELILEAEVRELLAECSHFEQRLVAGRTRSTETAMNAPTCTAVSKYTL